MAGDWGARHKRGLVVGLAERGAKDGVGGGGGGGEGRCACAQEVWGWRGWKRRDGRDGDIVNGKGGGEGGGR